MMPERGEIEDERPEQGSLARLTTEIVSAYVTRNPVATHDLAGVITSVGTCLRTLASSGATQAPPKPEPVVPIRRSIGQDYLICLLCGRQQKLLKRHLAVEHDLTPDEYRDTFGLRPDYPMAAPSYAAARSEMARRIGLGRPRTAARQGRGGRKSNGG